MLPTLMVEVGEAISSMMKVCGATKSTSSKVSGNLIMSVVIDVRRFYFMMRRKLVHRMKEVCGATSHMMKDELIVEEHQVDRTWLLIYIDIYTFAILVSQVRCYCNLYLHCYNVWTKFLYDLYSNSRVFIHYIEGHYFILFFVSIIGCHNCSYSAILIVFCTFKFSSMTLSLSLSFMCIGYCAIEY